MKGHSGATLTRNGNIVTKASTNFRLETQARRQLKFVTNVRGLRAIPVSSTKRTPEQFLMQMPFVDGVCPLHHRQPALHIIFDYISESVSASERCDVDGSTFTSKLDVIARTIHARPDIPAGWEQPFALCWRELSRGIKAMPVGPCHGDLTFTNMLQCNGELFLFDFLDNVIDSPLFDMVKLRQDTAHGWVNVVLEEPVDLDKLKTIDAVLDEGFTLDYECYRSYYRSIQAFNLLRILPYCRSPVVAEHVVKELKNLCM